MKQPKPHNIHHSAQHDTARQVMLTDRTILYVNWDPINFCMHNSNRLHVSLRSTFCKSHLLFGYLYNFLHVSW